MDPLSDVLSLLKVRSYVSGGFDAAGDWRVDFPAHEGVKLQAVLRGAAWVDVDGGGGPAQGHAGDCFLMPRGRAMRVGSRLDGPGVDAMSLASFKKPGELLRLNGGGDFLSAGGYFTLDPDRAGFLLGALPPLVHVRGERAQTVMRWCIDHMREEMQAPRPGGALVTQQLVQMLLVEALRAHLDESPAGVSWLFALADKHLNRALAAMHGEPAADWTVEKLARVGGLSRTAFALRFRDKVGETPMDYLTRWRMWLAEERLRASDDSVAEIAASLGYASESAFSAAFKRTMGAAPRRHARQGGAGLRAASALD